MRACLAAPALHRLKFFLDLAHITSMRLGKMSAGTPGWLRHEQVDDCKCA
jgi:hypothetical protein